MHKSVDISFVAGRKEGGLTAEINIEDQDIPGFTSGSDPAQLTLVASSDPVGQPANTEANTTAGDATGGHVEQESPAVDAPKTTSLFA